MENIKYHPILFSTPMVQAILDERKKQTRRTKGLEIVNLLPDHWKFEYLGKHPTNEKNKNLYAFFTVKGTETWFYQKCPFNVGDVLWVRETYASAWMQFLYKANERFGNYVNQKWKPSIFMPKEACRIFLKIKSIRCERLQDIREDDAIAEGVEKIADYGTTGYRLYTEPEASYSDIDAVYSFESLWESINGKDSWTFNPWVWVYEFEQIEKPNDFI